MLKKKTIVFTVLLSILAVLVAPIAVVIVGISIPTQFSDTYYGELGVMYDKLTKTEGKKIVVVGNSSVAFGVYSDFLEKELEKSELDYSVCNFGLYGSIGTKTMLDLSKNHIGEGDIVVFMPEIFQQSLSLYFSSQETWRALDSNMQMFHDLAKEDKSKLIYGYTDYVAEKYSFFQAENPASNTGIYSRASFDENCDMINGDRLYNVMNGGYDLDNPINFDTNLLNDEFFNYLNEYYAHIKAKGAEMYFTFCPVNRLALTQDCTEEKIDNFYDVLSKKIKFSILGNPHDSIMDHEWFYDSNVHLNASGMIVRTVGLLKDLKMALDCSVMTDITLPLKPEEPKEEVIDGDNAFLGYFEYEEDGKGYKITGLKDSGKALKTITVPTSYNGKAITSFAVNVFAGNTNITEITVQSNIVGIYNGSFDGCVSLTAIYIEQTNPEKISVGLGLLSGTQNCSVYVRQQFYASFITNYLWSHHQKDIKTYS